MVSEQKDTEFQNDDYTDLKKVYSIWIFMELFEAVKEGANSMCNYSDFVEEQGIKQGETRLGKLITVLLKEGLTDIVEIVATNESIRAEYYQKYNIN